MGTQLVDKNKPLLKDCAGATKDSPADEPVRVSEDHIYWAYSYSKDAFRSDWAALRRRGRSSSG